MGEGSAASMFGLIMGLIILVLQNYLTADAVHQLLTFNPIDFFTCAPTAAAQPRGLAAEPRLAWIACSRDTVPPRDRRCRATPVFADRQRVSLAPVRMQANTDSLTVSSDRRDPSSTVSRWGSVLERARV